MDRANPVDSEKDVDVAIELLLQGVQTKQIKEVLLATNKYGPERAYEIIKQARDLIKASAAFDRDEELGKAKRRLESLYYKFHKNKAYKDCLATQKEITDLVGLRTTVVKNINVDADKLAQEEKNRILKELNLLKEV
jgi:hypothetical protein